MTDSFFPDESQLGPAEPLPTGTAQEELRPPDPQTPEGDFLTEDSRMAAILSYIPFLCLVPLVNVSWKDDPQARFHARQGIALFLFELLAITMLIDDIGKFVFKALLVLAAGLSVAGIYFALQGKSCRLPIISELADKAKL